MEQRKNAGFYARRLADVRDGVVSVEAVARATIRHGSVPA
jgi:hypothetical protein